MSEEEYRGTSRRDTIIIFISIFLIVGLSFFGMFALAINKTAIFDEWCQERGYERSGYEKCVTFNEDTEVFETRKICRDFNRGITGWCEKER